MSHVTRLSLQMTSMITLKAALKRMKMEVEEAKTGSSLKLSIGSRNSADVQLRLKGQPIGFSKVNGNIEIVKDFYYAKGLNESEFIKALETAYTTEFVLGNAKKVGWTASKMKVTPSEVNFVLNEV
jgi:hypothetical protein